MIIKPNISHIDVLVCELLNKLKKNAKRSKIIY